MAAHPHPTYSRFPLATHEIRLLNISPAARRNDPITCHFTKAQLIPNNSNSFETISYTWGDASLHGEISVDGTTLRIPASAVAAIRNVRRKDKERVIWIDSVCINQADLEERSEQVKLMSTVYQQEQANLIHLADLRHEVAERAFQGVEAIVAEVWEEEEEEGRVGKKIQEIVFPDYGPWSFAKEGLKCEIDYEALAQMYELPWFRRLWVVQEAVLAHTNIIVCGDLSIDFEKVLTATCWLEHKTFSLKNEGSDKAKPFIPTLLGFRGAMNMWLFRWDLDVYKHNPIPTPLSWLLSKAPFGASSDVKDQIYGMLGLYQASAKTTVLAAGLAPDYTKNDAEVLRDATRAAIEERQNLELLERLPQHRDNRPAGLPTWVPEWFREHDNGDARALMPVFSACGTSEEWSRTELLPTKDPGVLRIKGVLVSTIDRVANDTRELKDLEPLLDHLEKVQAISSSLGIDPVTLGTTLLGGAGFDDTAAATTEEAELWLACRQYLYENRKDLPWRNELKPDASAEEKAMAMFNSTFRVACWNRCFFSTVDGHIGIGPIGSKPGDSIVVLQGGHFPFVVRERETGNEMIGYCFTHGVMGGEAVGRIESGSAEATVFDLT